MKKPRQQSCLFGVKAFEEAINNQVHIKLVNISIRHKKLIPLIEAKKINFQIHSTNWFNNQYRDINHQELVAVLDTNQLLIPLDQLVKVVENKKCSTLVMLDEIQDPYNFGAILRTCLASEVDGIIFKKNNQVPINNTVMKTSMGSVFYQNLVQVANLSYTITKLKEIGFWTVVSTLDPIWKPIDYRKVDFAKKILIVGNEDRGVNQLITKNADCRIKIPMNNKINSLNVSVALGIILFAWKN
ncbi:23S rRNA (guanosine(2251)-2'-O)-methyltransferase RlmB [Mycoplasmoides genitalium]|uniref:Uncharacterized tRNA/rRNA methyltransferase MG252 n=2 Tax=Mycoplasmoides genitalium TaxID=2097 RepID=Y252_MYCGE|nr:23S rRNA (guanosine(2251)-2'-O)-methyltransferase RlmB [Mycoplasmoides genitalium]P47494.1 RecName: Full=Uncharacterized tRNA/rRNA methyltransferase MG252 [Mycoplasmoides genitalium G37]ABY79694.1 RNA methyltransferase, TrmH family, group 3 [synthetic Mycoplasma genitalium JCVI-1.0]AAC71472.1 RNA methyltransferase, TrmH family, group 3 [Mycoplasmoides genitalium G37]AFQ03082.1 RNA methyltransferase [Mycoplasmoides genitalium M2321]AFQ03570.1 RNA methyltransferase [Mycoplasmoides genitalium 